MPRMQGNPAYGLAIIEHPTVPVDMGQLTGDPSITYIWLKGSRPVQCTRWLYYCGR